MVTCLNPGYSVVNADGFGPADFTIVTNLNHSVRLLPSIDVDSVTNTVD